VRSGQLVADRYRLEELIGAGGMGVVWRAVDTELGRVVAVKHASPGQGRQSAERLRREAKNAARVHHPNAVTLFDAVREDTDCWLIMEYVPADSLATTVDRHGPLDPRSAARIAAQIAAALAALHAGGIVHRDVKPGNVLVTEHGLAKLTDFGISRWAEETLTHTGPEPGTPAYQAPEVTTGRPATSASDVYSLGATLFAIVEGKPPRGDELVSGARLTSRTESLRAVMDELLALDPAQRPTADAARTMLDAFSDDTTVPMPGPAPVVSDATPAARTGSTMVPRQLPAAPRLFVGRRDELDRLGATLHDAAAPAATVVISAIAGAGGIGKTWLALHWAHRHIDRFPDGQLFVDLLGFSPTGRPAHPGDVLGGFLDAMGVDRDRQPTDLDRRAELYRSLVADKRMLVVLDNAATTDQVTPLLPGDRHCTVVVTSRNHLRGLVARHGARPVRLDVLTDTEAHTLLATTLGPDRTAGDAQTITELIELCGGFPLALGLVAARAAADTHLPLRDIIAELRALGLDALDSEDPTASLPTVLSWSLHHLTDQQREVFALLGIAPGPNTGLPATACLTSLPDREAHVVLRTLTDASLIDQAPGGRYGMHDLVRAYATTIAEDLPAEMRKTALRRVLDFYTHTAHAADRLLHPHRDRAPFDPATHDVHPHPLPDTPAVMAWFDAEHACLLAAQHVATTVDWHATVWHLAWSLHTFHYRQGHLHDELTVWQAAADAASHLPDPTTLTLAHQYLGRAHADLGHHEDAIAHLHQALSFAEHHHDPAQQAHIHNALGWAWERRGDDRKAFDHARRALDLYRSLDQPMREARALNAVGWCAARLGDYDTGREHCQAALTLYRHHHNPEGEAATLDSLGYIDHHSGHHTQAIDHHHDALILYRDLSNTYEAANTLDRLGHPHAALGQHEQARTVWREALRLYKEQGRHDDAHQVQQQLNALDQTEAGHEERQPDTLC
jgi:tetratricopeptide (TPR) repeat protein